MSLLYMQIKSQTLRLVDSDVPVDHILGTKTLWTYFLVQVISTVGLKVEGVNNEEPFDLKPGMYVYLPRGTHHQVFPRESRVSFSFGVEGNPDPSMYY